MWEVLVRAPRGSNNPRKFSMMLATFLVACFGYIFLTAPSAHAADANWDGDTIVYANNSFTQVPANTNLPDDIQSGATVYRYVDDSKTPNLVHFIFFSEGTDNPKSAKEATYIRFTLNPPNSYVNPTPKQTITITPTEELPTPDTDDGTFTDTCTIDGIGWIVCPLMYGISEGMDFIYERIQAFLVVQPISTSIDNPIYRVWVYSRDLANIAFIIGFMVIIYSYLVGGGFSGYEIRKILPRLVVAAILINVSYIICAAAVDISNIAGYGVNQLFETVRDNVVSGSSAGDEVPVNWTSVTTWVLGGTGGIVAGGLLLPGAVGGAAAGLWFLLAPFLVGAALLVIVTFLILAARQAIIVIAIVIAPLAFAAFILPNTEKWFEKWRSLFFTMLIMFPAFGAVFGGAQLAGELIIRTANSIEQVILGLGVMVAPLAITPLLLRLGGGVLNRIGGIINNSEKGVFDRFKNYNNERRQDFLAARHRENAERAKNGDTMGRFRRAAYNQNLKKYNRGRLREANTAAANALYDDNDRGIETARSMMGRRYAQARGRDYDPSFKYGSAEIADVKHRSDELHQSTEARHERHWNEKFDIQNDHFDQALFDQRIQTLRHKDKSKLAESRMETAWTEMQAGSNPYQAAGIQGPTSQTLQAQIDDIADTARSISMEGLKKQSAEVVIKQTNAKRLKMHADLRDYVGGVGGADASARVFAAAKSEVVKDYLDSVKAMGSVQEAYDLTELIEVAHSGRRPPSQGGGAATEAEIDSAIQQIVTVKGNNWSYQKLKDRIAKEGVDYRDGVYYEPGTDTVIDPDVAEGRRTRQQIFVEAAKNSKLAIKNLSGTDRGNLETGTFTLSSEGPRGTIVRDIRDQKINAERLAGTDIDELMHMVQVLRDDDARGALSAESRNMLISQIEFATDPNNPQISGKIAPREKKMMGVVAEYLRHGRDMSMDQKKAAENATETPIPTNYNPDSFYGMPAKYTEPGKTDARGNPVPREPYGPDGDTTFRGADPDADN